MPVLSKPWRARLMSGAAFAAIALGAGFANAQEARTINIAPQSLSTALYEFGGQTGRQVMFTPEVTAAKRTTGITTTADEQVALAELLRGTGLTFRRQDNVFVIIPADGASDPQSASAAGDGADGTVQALIVTAQKREENIQDVPIAMSAFTQETLERSQVAGGPDLMTQVPNMTFTKTNFTGYSIQLRGIGTQAISATTDAAVAVAFNNTPFIRSRFFEQEFYDLQRVEVLRGPQGTLYGRNATAGVVNLISQKPKFTYEAKVSADIANYNSRRLEGMLNIPLVDDKVGLRIAGAWTKRDGFDTNAITGGQIDGRDLWSTRVSLRITPTDKLDATLIWEHFQEDDDRLRSGKQLCHQDDREYVGSPQNPLLVTWIGYGDNLSQGCLPASMYSPDAYEAPNGYSLPYYYPLTDLGVPIIQNFDPYASLTQSRDLRVIESTVDPKYRAKSDLAELQVSYHLSDTLTLTSETAYNYDTVYSLEDYNRFNTASGAFGEQPFLMFRPGTINMGSNGFPEFCDPQIGCADRIVAIDVSRGKSNQFSQELRLASDFDGPFNFSLGANYLRYDGEDKYYVFINTITMMAAAATNWVLGVPFTDPWVPNGTDNYDCLLRGQRPPDPNHHGELQGCIYIDPDPLESVNDLGHNYFLSKNPYKLISYAVFGEAYWNITEDLKLTAGLRMTHDKKEAPRIPSWLTAAHNVGYAVQAVEDQVWNEPTGRLALDWKPDLGFTDDTLLYASYAHGYKAGGSNPPPAGVVIWRTLSNQDAEVKVAQSAAKPKTFDPEFVDAFELGTKNTFADGRATLNLAAFYYDYTGYQVSQIIDRSASNYNFDAKIWGLEIEGDWRPLENLRLGLKGGYEHTEIADRERAIDIMNRVAGHPDWIVVKPFPSFPSNCVLPDYVVDPEGDGIGKLTAEGGNMTACENAYVLGMDPITRQIYPDAELPASPPDPSLPDYPGFNPKHDYGTNNGEGFFTELGGHELPNAPHFTATLTADYTLPLPSDWLMTLHTDLYYQSEAWTRVFNTEGYDKLKAYTNVNLAAIFANEDAGWKVMAYIKNVFDRDSITGAFLNSDDTGLTTNVFLTEPRLYGLRLTRDFNGGPWWTGATGTGPFPLWLELGGMVARNDADYASVKPARFDLFSDAIDPTVAQHRDLDWGDGREVRVSYKPVGGRFSLAAEYRFGDASNGVTRVHAEEVAGPPRCALDPAGPSGAICANPPQVEGFSLFVTGRNWSDSAGRDHEEHALAGFEAGMDVGLGSLSSSTIGAGIRYAHFRSETSAVLDGVPNMKLPENGWLGNPTTYDRYRSTIESMREFGGLGPMVSWEAATRLFGSDEAGHVNVDWSIEGGVLFGKQRTAEVETSAALGFSGQYTPEGPTDRIQTLDFHPMTSASRSTSAKSPFVDLSLGLSYEIQRVKIGAGYRWERYFDVLDAGYTEHKDYDRTIDGPYFKVAVGFGG